MLDDDLLSGRLANNLEPVIYQQQENKELTRNPSKPFQLTEDLPEGPLDRGMSNNSHLTKNSHQSMVDLNFQGQNRFGGILQIGFDQGGVSSYKTSTVPSMGIRVRNQKTHQDMMNQIEGQRKHNRSRSGNGSKVSMYRSPSVFMAHAEIAAGSFANKQNKIMIRHTVNSLKNSPERNALKTQEDDDIVNMQQLTNRSPKQAKKRVTTANDSYQNNQFQNFNFTKSRKRDKNSLIMSQTQQNLNKLRMSRQSIQNLQVISQRTTDLSCNFGIAGRHMSQASYYQKDQTTAMKSKLTLSQDEKNLKVPRLDLEKRHTVEINNNDYMQSRNMSRGTKSQNTMFRKRNSRQVKSQEQKYRNITKNLYLSNQEKPQKQIQILGMQPQNIQDSFLGQKQVFSQNLKDSGNASLIIQSASSVERRQANSPHTKTASYMSKDHSQQQLVKNANLDLKIPFSSKKKEKRLDKLKNIIEVEKQTVQVQSGSHEINPKTNEMRKKHPNLSFSKFNMNQTETQPPEKKSDDPGTAVEGQTQRGSYVQFQIIDVKVESIEQKNQFKSHQDRQISKGLSSRKKFPSIVFEEGKKERPASKGRSSPYVQNQKYLHERNTHQYNPKLNEYQKELSRNTVALLDKVKEKTGATILQLQGSRVPSEKIRGISVASAVSDQFKTNTQANRTEFNQSSVQPLKTVYNLKKSSYNQAEDNQSEHIKYGNDLSPIALSPVDRPTLNIQKIGIKNEPRKKNVGVQEDSCSHTVNNGPETLTSRAAQEASSPVNSIDFKSVKEVHENIQQKKRKIDTQRQKNKQEFERRQKEMEERKNSNNRYVQKKQIMISDQIMGSPIQKMGRVSNISRREEAVLGEKVIVDREVFLREQLSLKEPEKKEKPNLYNPIPNVSSKLIKKIVGGPPPPDFSVMDLIQTKQDETVFSRINPHLPEVKAKVNLPDHSLNALLKKNGGMPLCRKQQEPKRIKGQKAYHEMTEFEQKTFNFIHKLRREMKAESIQATLVQYIKTNKDEEKLNEFCRELLSSLHQKNGEKKSPGKKKSTDARRTASIVEEEKPEKEMKKGLAALDHETRKEMFLGNKVSQELKDIMVEEYLSLQEQQRLDKLKKEEENLQFEKMTKQQKGTRFALTKQERERILQKLSDIYLLENKQKQYMRLQKQQSMMLRMEKFQKSSFAHIQSQEKVAKLKEIAQKMEKRRQMQTNPSMESMSSCQESLFEIQNEIPAEEQVQVKVNPLNFDELNPKKITDEQMLLNHFDEIIINIQLDVDQMSFNSDQEQAFITQAQNLDLNVLNNADPMEIVVDTELTDREFFKEYVQVFEKKQKRLDQYFGKIKEYPESKQASEKGTSQQTQSYVGGSPKGTRSPISPLEVSTRGEESEKNQKIMKIIEVESPEPLQDILEIEVESSKCTERSYRMGVFEQKMINVPNKKLMQTAHANNALLKNIQRSKSNGLQLKNSRTLQNLRSKTTERTRPTKSQDRLQIFDITRSCHKMLGVATSFEKKKDKLFGKYNQKLEKVAKHNEKILQIIDQIKQNQEKVRLNEQRDDFGDILIENIKEDLNYDFQNIQEMAKISKQEVASQKHIKEFLRDQQLKAMIEQNK